MSGRTMSAAVRALEAAKIPFALIGAMAMASHGLPRTTEDADLLVTQSRALDPEVWSAVARRMRVDRRVGDSSDPLVGVVRVGTPRSRVPVDVVIPRGAWLVDVIERARASGRMGVVDGVEVPLVTLPDLVLLKADAAGTIDLLDIELILQTWPERRDELLLYVDERLHLLDPYGQERWRLWRPRLR